MPKCVVAEGYGGPEVLAVQDIALPPVEPGRVLLEVKAAGTNPFDYKRYSGYMGDDPADLPVRLGLEVAGVVVDCAAGTTGYTGELRVGDEVIAAQITGGYAEQLVVDADAVGHKPASLNFEEAAGLVLTSATAWHLLEFTRVGSGDTVLIHGASGGVGLPAVQLAVARGATVIATASPPRHEQLRRYGAIPVAYGDGLVDRVRDIGQVDAALDLVGTDEALDSSAELVADRTRIASINGFARAPQLGIAVLTGDDGGDEIRAAARPKLLDLAAEGRLEVTIDRTFPLAEAAEAHRYLQKGHARGKVVLLP